MQYCSIVSSKNVHRSTCRPRLCEGPYIAILWTMAVCFFTKTRGCTQLNKANEVGFFVLIHFLVCLQSTSIWPYKLTCLAEIILTTLQKLSFNHIFRLIKSERLEPSQSYGVSIGTQVVLRKKIKLLVDQLEQNEGSSYHILHNLKLVYT